MPPWPLLITAPLLLIFMGTDAETEWLRLLIMATVTTGVAIGVTFLTPRTREEVLLAFYERVQPFGFWANTARLAGDRPNAPLESLNRRAWAIAITALSLFLLLLGVGRLMISPPDASPLWTWVAILAGLALVPLWLRYLWRDDALDVDRSLRPEDVEVSDRTLLDDPAGLLLALRQLGRHMKVVYGMEVAVEPRGAHRIEAYGQRVVLFEIIQDLLVFIAARDRQARVLVTVSRQDDHHLIELAPEGAGIDFGRPPERARGLQPLAYDILERISERLWQVGGELEVEPDRRRAQRLIMRTAIDSLGAPTRVEPAAVDQAAN